MGDPMLVRLRKRRPTAVTLSVKFPINAASRAAVDAENHRVRGCVIPITGAKNGRPYLEGSAVALTYRGKKCLATALHVLTRNQNKPLFFFGADFRARPLNGRFETSTEHDLAAVVLSDEDAEALSHVPFLQEHQIGSAAEPDGRFYASVAGYPHTASRLIDKVTLDTPMEVYSNTGWEKAGGLISVYFNKKEGALDKECHRRPRDPIGKSGGAIFGMPRLGLNAVQFWQSTKLVGLATHWKRSEHRIVGASVAMLIPLLDQVVHDN